MGKSRTWPKRGEPERGYGVERVRSKPKVHDVQGEGGEGRQEEPIWSKKEKA